MKEPFWELGYRDDTVSTFAKGPTADVAAFFAEVGQIPLMVLDVGCGEGRNALHAASLGHRVEAFDLSEAGVAKAKRLAAARNIVLDLYARDLAAFEWTKDYDVIWAHGVLHLPEKAVRDRFLVEAKAHTRPGGYHLIGIFTNREPATPDNAPFTKSLFAVGELPRFYADWTLLDHAEGVLEDSHPGGVHHVHAYERILARRS